jgi:septum formation protein
MHKNTVYLASSSAMRRKLLEESKIPFQLISQNAAEDFDAQLPLEEIVSILAVRKMAHVQIPKAIEKRELFVVTADTLVQDKNGVIQNKPINYENAQEKIRAISGISYISTGFCLEKKVLVDSCWQTQEQIVRAVTAQCYFEIPEDQIDNYLKNTDALAVAGAVTIEQYGTQFLKEIHGSYTAILGLPLYELREELSKLDFFD